VNENWQICSWKHCSASNASIWQQPQQFLASDCQWLEGEISRSIKSGTFLSVPSPCRQLLFVHFWPNSTICNKDSKMKIFWLAVSYNQYLIECNLSNVILKIINEWNYSNKTYIKFSVKSSKRKSPRIYLFYNIVFKFGWCKYISWPNSVSFVHIW
jgi:hypothetical protein